jgi:hypothetical protein
MRNRTHAKIDLKLRFHYRLAFYCTFAFRRESRKFCGFAAFLRLLRFARRLSCIYTCDFAVQLSAFLMKNCRIR